jgi:hypothetical protein
LSETERRKVILLLPDVGDDANSRAIDPRLKSQIIMMIMMMMIMMVVVL